MYQEAFISYLRYEERLSPHTVLAYSNDLAQFFIYLKTVYSLDDIKEVNHSIIRSWIVASALPAPMDRRTQHCLAGQLPPAGRAL